MTTVDKMRVVHPIPGMVWTELRTAALEFARRGWPVMPGTFQSRDDLWRGKPGTRGLEPIDEAWSTAATTDSAVVVERWTRKPYNVLLSCGLGIDVVEIDRQDTDALIRALLKLGTVAPVADTPLQRSLVFVQSDTFTAREDRSERVCWHRGASWVPLPPTSRSGVADRWRITPSARNWKLPSGTALRQALAAVYPSDER